MVPAEEIAHGPDGVVRRKGRPAFSDRLRHVVILRAQTVEDLPLLTGGDSVFTDFGPGAPRTAPAPPSVDAPGGLTVDDDDGAVAGQVSWTWSQRGPSAGSRCLIIGITLRAEHRGRGIGTAAQRQLIELLFRHCPVHRIEASTELENIAEQRALKSAGLHREGVLRNALWRDGAYRDEVLYAVLRTDLLVPPATSNST